MFIEANTDQSSAACAKRIGKWNSKSGYRLLRNYKLEPNSQKRTGQELLFSVNIHYKKKQKNS